MYIMKFQILQKGGFESRHNLDCWKQKEYIGFGVAAHSYMNGIRYSNAETITEYLQNYKDKIIHERQDKTSMAKEFVLLSLRTLQGCNLREFEKKFDLNLKTTFEKEITKLETEKLVKLEGNYLKLTSKGLDLANLVWEEFI